MIYIENNVWDYLKTNKIKAVKSPCRYPGGKSKALSQILPLIPYGEDIYSPFLGGGSIELACASTGQNVYASDKFDSVYYFWKVLLKVPKELSKMILDYYPLSKEQFYELRNTKFKTQREIATQFYVLNRSSFSGSTMSGGMSPNHPRFKLEHIKNLENFKLPNLSILDKECRDFSDTIKKAEKNFIYLDPPYYEATKLYGKNGDMHEGFDHEKLAKCILKKKYWIMSYDNCNEIRELYKGLRILTPSWKYGMSKNKSSNEILILSENFPDIRKN